MPTIRLSGGGYYFESFNVNIMTVKYQVTVIKTQQQIIFKTIPKAKAFIENWCNENNEHCGRVDIDKRTLLWHVGTFKNPVIQFEKLINNL